MTRAWAGPAYAVNYVVGSTADGPDMNPGDGVCATAAATCTLRAAMQDAQALGAANTITLLGLPDPSTIDLGSPLPTISGQTLTIVGAGQDALTVRRASGGDYPIFKAMGGDVTIRGMTVTQGRAVAQGGPVVGGGGIYSVGGSLKLEHVGVVGNAAATSGANASAEGGGVYKEQGTLTIQDSTISQNTVDATSTDDGLAFGGGIAAASVEALDVFDSTIGHNSVSATGPDDATASGGGIVAFGNAIEIVDSTVSTNSAAVAGAESGEASGGGIWAFGNAFSMVRSTVDHNSATAANVPTAPVALGGGVYVQGTAVVNVVSSTISANSVRTAAQHDPVGPAGWGRELPRGGSQLAGVGWLQPGERRQLQADRAWRSAQHEPVARCAGEQRRADAHPRIGEHEPGAGQGQRSGAGQPSGADDRSARPAAPRRPARAQRRRR